MPDAGQQLLKASFASSAPDEALRHPTGALLGVSPAAQTALEDIGTRTVFDLAASRIFATASALLAAQRDPTMAEVRLNAVAADAVEAPAGVPVVELADQPISILRGIGAANEPSLRAALDVASVRDLALWPPYAAAKAMLDLAYFPEKAPGFDPDAPADLLPKSGVYPTERIFFRKLVLDAVPAPDQAAQPIETAAPIDLGAALAAPPGFQRLATGALLSFSQSWFAQGLTLGQLLHSTSLAPGESTRIAMIDWERRTRASASETISEAEALTNTMTHSRAVSEVTNATAREFQSGQSQTTTTSDTLQGGGAFGLEIGPLALGGSGGGSTSTTESMSVSSSFGERELAASYAQQINDRSQQNASSVRNRRASIVREVSQEEHEQISTRVVTNYNHMHALSIQYYEVVQAFRVTTQLERAEKCLFVPLKLMSFRDQAFLDRWRVVLAGAPLTLRALRQLTVEYGVVEVIPQTPRVTPGRLIVADVRVRAADLRTPMRRRAPDAAPPAEGGAERPATEPPAPPEPPPPPPAPDYVRAPVNTPAAVLAAKGWNIEQLNAIGWATGRVLARGGSDSVFVSDDALVLGFSLRDGQAARFSVRRHDGAEVPAEHSSATAFGLRDPIPITELQSISIQTMGDRDLRTSLMLQLNVLGTVFPLDVPVALRPMTALQEAVKFGGAGAARELVDHLEANRLHYSQAIYRALDAAAIAALLAPYTYRGLPLGQVVDPQPLAVTANFLVFRLSVSASGRSEDERWAAEETEWRKWLAARGLDRPAPKTEIIPLPSGGVFAEAVLGRYNAAERIDLQRFWNWQDSPIPIVAPEIAPVQAGSRALPEDIRPGQLSQPVVNIQTPTSLPDPTGVGAIIGAIQQGNMFRDMSGLAQTAALAQAALQAGAQGATSAAQQAGTNMKTVVDAHTERMRIAAQLAAQMMGVPATGAGGGGGGGGGGQNSGRGSVTERGGELNVAEAIDAERAANGIAGGASPGAGNGGFGGEGNGGGAEASGGGGNGGGGGGASTTKADLLQQKFAGSREAIKTAELVRDALLESEDLPSSGTGRAARRVAEAPRARDLKVEVRFVESDVDRGLEIPDGNRVKFYGGEIGIKVFERGMDPKTQTKFFRQLAPKGGQQEPNFFPTAISSTEIRNVVEMPRRTGVTGTEVFVHAWVRFLDVLNNTTRTLNVGKFFPMPVFTILKARVYVESNFEKRDITATDEADATAKLIQMVPVEFAFQIRDEVKQMSPGKFKGTRFFYTGDMYFVDKQGRELR